MAHVCRAYHPEAKLPDQEAELSALYNSLLNGKRALLLMDNARDRAQVEPLIPPTGCALIVTSRQRFTLPGLYEKDLDALPPADARELLLRIAKRIGDHADEIARLCGRLPLALRVAASAIAERKNMSPADYVRRLGDEKQRLSHLKEVDVALSVSCENDNGKEGSGLSSLTFDLLAFTVMPSGVLSSLKSPARALAPPQPVSSPLKGRASTPRLTRDC